MDVGDSDTGGSGNTISEKIMVHHNRVSDYFLIGLTLSMFITNMVLIAVLVSYSYRVVNNEQRYIVIKQDFSERLEELERKEDVRYGRLSESVSILQQTTNKRLDLINQRIGSIHKEAILP